VIVDRVALPFLPVRQAIPFGKYLLLDRISVGGMAEVFKAKSYGVEGFEKVIAIKRILPSMGEDRDFIKMFIDEAKIAGQLAHANICQIFELGRIDGQHFIAMEFIWGKDLLQITNRLRKLKQAMPISMACFAIAKVCEGLDYAHRRRDALGRPLEIVHRDCSPQNVLVSYEGEVKIIDFGIAKAASRGSRTQAGVLKGKFSYMSPEQVRGLPLDRRCDIFALGTILYECLTGERLFQGETDFSTLEKVRNVDIQRPTELNRNIPPEVEAVIMKALAKDADDRYQWCSEMHADLQRYLMNQEQVYTSKSVATWLREAFAGDMDRERKQLEDYKRVGRDGLIAGMPAAEAKLDVVEHLGEAGTADDPTMLGAPSFEDMSAAAEPAGPAPGSPAATGRDSSPDFAEEAPTAIFGEIGGEAAAILEQARAQVAAQQRPAPAPPPASIPSVLVRHPTGPMPVAGRAPTNPPVRAQTAPPAIAPPAMAPPAMAPPPMAMSPRAPSAPIQVPSGPMPMPMGGQSSSKTLLGVAAPILPQQGGAPLSPYPSPGAFPAMGSSPAANGYGQAPAPYPPQYGAPHDFSNLMAPQAQQPAYPGMPPAQMAAHGAPVFTPPGYPQALPLPAGVLSPPGMPAYRDDYQSGAITPLAVGATVDVSPPRPRTSMRKDIIIGVGIAASVLGIFAIVWFAVLGGGGGGGGATTGSLVVTLADNQPADVFVNGEKRGTVAGGTFKIEKIAAGKYDVKVVRAGAADCAQSVKLDENGLAMVRCEFAAAAPPAPIVVPPDAAVVAMIAGDAAEVATADAMVEPAVVVDAGVAVVSDAAVAAVVVPPDAAVVAIIEPTKPAPTRPDPIKVITPTKPEPTKPDPIKVIKPTKPEPTKPDPIKVIKPTKPDPTKPARPDPTRPDPTKPDPHATKDPVVAAPSTDEGYLVAYTTPFSRVVIDGVDTGKTTPIGPRGRIPLKPGKHKIKFVVGDQSETVTITIEGGKTAKVTRDLQIGAGE
jgi:serine/threonine protein kinase